MRKGVSLFSDLFMVFALIAVSLLFTAFLWAVVTVYSIAGPNAREITMNTFDYPVRNDGALLAFLEIEENGIPMKELITQSAIKETTTISYKGISNIDIAAISDKYIKQFYPNKKYVLVIESPDFSQLVLAQGGSLTRPQSLVSADIFLPDKTASLKLFVSD